MSQEELKKAFLDIFLAIPTKNPVTPVQMKSMDKLAEAFASLPEEEAKEHLDMFKVLIKHPERAMAFLENSNINPAGVQWAKKKFALIEEAKEIEKKRQS
jgi:hypothetical protein